MLDASVAVNVTVVSPSGNDSGALLVIVTSLTVSDAVAELSVTDVSVPVASTDTSAGAVMDGDVISIIVTV